MNFESHLEYSWTSLKSKTLRYCGRMERLQTLEKLTLQIKVKCQRNRGRPNIYWETDVEDWMGASVWRSCRSANLVEISWSFDINYFPLQRKRGWVANSRDLITSSVGDVWHFFQGSHYDGWLSQYAIDFCELSTVGFFVCAVIAEGHEQDNAMNTIHNTGVAFVQSGYV